MYRLFLFLCIEFKIFIDVLKKTIVVKALQQNYIFAALNERDLEACMLSMEIVEITKGDDIITQGLRSNSAGSVS